jgi:hypothetical protein
VGRRKKGLEGSRGIKRRFFAKVKKRMGEEGIEEDWESIQQEKKKGENWQPGQVAGLSCRFLRNGRTNRAAGFDSRDSISGNRGRRGQKH